MIKKAVVVAFVVLLKVVAENYLPNIPITEELINTLVLGLLAWLGVDVVEVALRGVVERLKSRGLW